MSKIAATPDPYQQRPHVGMDPEGNEIRFQHAIDLRDAIRDGHAFPTNPDGSIDLIHVPDVHLAKAEALAAELEARP